ncbi:MAG: sec-independent protein translocase TatC [Acidimicrobiia bacterium]|nr:sec-independent protein translocase TatC [Acidimicrobiia bacterium]
MSTNRPWPTPSRDLDDPAEIAELVRRFYGEVAQDDLLGPMFEEVAHVDWAEHLPKLTAFWCRALLGVEGYSGNPFGAHRRIHELRAFRLDHFERWLTIFEETIDLGWEGDNAERAKELARTVARVHSKQLVGTAYEAGVVVARRRAAGVEPRPVW